MSVSRIAPYMIAYLLGVATPVLFAMKLGMDRDSQGDGCLLGGILVAIVFLIALIGFLWLHANSLV